MSKTSLRYTRQEFENQVWLFLERLAIIPRDITIFYEAFVHKSVLNEAGNFYDSSNERLEFLGDAILELVITEQLFHDFPQKPEWELTDIRSAIVRWRNLASIAKSLFMSDVIQLSRGEFRVSGHENPYILANVMEAFIGAIYLDQSSEIAKKWILENIYISLPEIIERWLYVDPKSYLQEFTQEVWWILPEYSVESEEGQDHNKVYIIQVSLGGVILWKWRWTSKKKWEQDAAENAISIKKEWEKKISLPRKANCFN